MGLEMITLNKVSQAQKDKVHVLLHVEARPKR
jgi:hypothetical protein